MLIAAGTMLEGKYRIERLLGAGGMGSVWIAEHTLLGRPVAVKVLDSSAAKKDATAVTRFLREAQTAARLRSDHIVDVLDVGRFEDGTPFLVMELLEGETLSSRIRRAGRLSWLEAADLVDQLLAGLAEAHAAGVIHRDIKPDNCFITPKSDRDHLKLLDFGISKVASDDRDKRMTRTGVVMGTPYYMAPEQARGAREIDHRCDLYAAGAILSECVTGRVPFEAESVNELLFKIVLEPLVPPRAIVPELDPAFEHVVLRAMAREASARYQTASEFRAALASFSGRAPRTVTIAQPALEPSSAPIRGNEPTAPIESDALRSATPTGLQGLSATGPLHLSDAPASKSRSTALLATAAVAVVAIGFGAAYLATSGAPLAENDAAAAQPPPSSTTPPSATSPSTSEPAEPPSAPSVEPPRPPPSTSPSPSYAADVKPVVAPPAKKASGTLVKAAPAPPPKTAAAPPSSAPAAPPPLPPPPPAPPATTKPGSPRPIDTAL